MSSELSPPVQFCTECKSLLGEIPICGRCNTANELKDKEITIERNYPGRRGWDQEIIKAARATMNIECSQCGAQKMYYTSRQMRSADEGETVFLECPKCGYKTVQN
ncbi:unnamed protein product [Blepharisma stoltei]|uniref:DNA-directed RNA polymerase I subunit RPA12 n=1 Tax=Blepharisma stoltei TaxID=1481888 RepID=A0AAU9JNX0_9CILI|nr:unnamed protein product [Blepharisma stoltei]